MKRLNNLIFLLLGLVLLWLALRNMALKELAVQLSKANYWLIIPVFGVTLFGYWVRLKRWNLLFGSVDERVSFRSTWVAMCAGYLVSFVIPRSGEITRCLIVKRYHNVPFYRSFATVIVERATDTLCLLLLILLILVMNVQQTALFFTNNIIHPLQEKIGNALPLVTFGAIALICLVLFAVLRWKKKSEQLWFMLIDVTRQLLKLKHKMAYLIYTMLIWICYYLMTYLWIFSFEESASLSAATVFVIMIIGTVGKSVPVQGGGIGAYHYLVAQAFLLFGVGIITGNALAIIIHGAQALYTFLTGGSAYLMMMYDEKKRNFVS